MTTVAGELGRQWVQYRGYDVTPVWHFTMIRKLFGQFAVRLDWPEQECWRQGQFRIADLISKFIGQHDGRRLPSASCTPFYLTADYLRVPGPSRRKRQKTSTRLFFQVGQMGVTRTGKLVIVARVHKHVDMSRVSASLDQYPFFAFGSKGARSCWHASRTHHRCRILFGPESCCERLGSILHIHWDASQGLSPGPLMDRVHLTQAHVVCVGGGRDELLVQEVTHILVDRLGKKTRPEKKSNGRSCMTQQVLDSHTRLAASGREFRRNLFGFCDEERGLLEPAGFSSQDGVCVCVFFCLPVAGSIAYAAQTCHGCSCRDVHAQSQLALFRFCVLS
jgi:hypothetical protein